MGLDITYYSRLKLDETVKADDEDAYATHLVVYDNSDFPGRSAPLVNRGCYTFEDSDGFRAGSYSGYNHWRERLAKLAGYPAVSDLSYSASRTHSAGAWHATSGPFWELINFADNEGTIGTVAATKLAADFVEWDERAKAASEADGEPYFYEKYVEWRTAFEAAADGGAVDFH